MSSFVHTTQIEVDLEAEELRAINAIGANGRLVYANKQYFARNGEEKTIVDGNAVTRLLHHEFIVPAGGSYAGAYRLTEAGKAMLGRS